MQMHRIAELLFYCSVGNLKAVKKLVRRHLGAQLARMRPPPTPPQPLSPPSSPFLCPQVAKEKIDLTSQKESSDYDSRSPLHLAARRALCLLTTCKSSWVAPDACTRLPSPPPQ
jgi:hypothetical protein